MKPNSSRPTPSAIRRLPRMVALLSLSLSGGAICHGQPNPEQPLAFAIVNAANYDDRIAQGSVFVIFGQNLGPNDLIQASVFPLPNQLGGTSIVVSAGSRTLNCPMVYSQYGQVSAILPSATPTGPGELRITFNGVSNDYTLPFNVAPSAPGIFTMDSSGLGPGIFTGLDNALRSFTVSARVGEIVTAWATGLGPISGTDNAPPPAFPNFAGVEVFVGNLAAKVIYGGRSGCCAGIDQISFEIPEGIAGCYIPVAVRAGGAMSNFVTLATGADGGACSDAAPTLPVEVVGRPAGAPPLRVATFSVGPLGALRRVGFDQERFVADRLSAALGVRVSGEEAAALVRALETRNRRAAMRALTRHRRAVNKLDSDGRKTLEAQLNLSQLGATASFSEHENPALLASAIGSLFFPSAGACAVGPSIARGQFQERTRGLQAGFGVTLTGPTGNWTLVPIASGRYQVGFGATASGPTVPPGAYSVTGYGGRGVEPFSASLDVETPLTWTNKADVSTVDRSQPLTITWTGGADSGHVVIVGHSEGTEHTESRRRATFVCTEDVAKGTFTVPSHILSALEATTTRGALVLGPHPLSRRLTIPGMDLAYFVDGSSDSKSVGFK